MGVNLVAILEVLCNDIRARDKLAGGVEMLVLPLGNVRITGFHATCTFVEEKGEDFAAGILIPHANHINTTDSCSKAEVRSCRPVTHVLFKEQFGGASMARLHHTDHVISKGYRSKHRL